MVVVAVTVVVVGGGEEGGVGGRGANAERVLGDREDFERKTGAVGEESRRECTEGDLERTVEGDRGPVLVHPRRGIKRQYGWR